MKKRNWLLEIAKFLLSILPATALLMCISIGIEGMYLLGVPEIDEVEMVTVAYPEVTDEIKEFTDEENIWRAVKLTGFLRYSLFSKAETEQKEMITITYFLENGETLTVSANNETVWWKGKAHVLKDDESFINLTEGIFFSEDLPAEK